MAQDFGAFAKQFGGTVETPAPPSVTAQSSFASFAKRFGGQIESPIPNPKSTTTPRGLVTPATLDPFTRPALKHPEDDDGSTSSVSFERDGKEILIPTTFEDKPGAGARRHSVDESIKHYDATGEHFGIFDSPDAADVYAKAMDTAQQQHAAASQTRRTTTWQEQRDAARPAGSVTTLFPPATPVAIPAAPVAAARVPVAGRGTNLDVRKSDASIFAEPFKGPAEVVSGVRDLVGARSVNDIAAAGHAILAGGAKTLAPVLGGEVLSLAAAGAASEILAFGASLIAAHRVGQLGALGTTKAGGTPSEVAFASDLASLVAGVAAIGSIPTGEEVGATATARDVDVAARRSAAKTLGVRPDADADAIHSAYLAKAKANHPDVNPDADPAAMTNINLAYEWLQDHPAPASDKTTFGDWVKRQATWLKSKLPSAKAPETPTAASGVPELTGDVAPVAAGPSFSDIAQQHGGEVIEAPTAPAPSPIVEALPSAETPGLRALEAARATPPEPAAPPPTFAEIAQQHGGEAVPPARIGLGVDTSVDPIELDTQTIRSTLASAADAQSRGEHPTADERQYLALLQDEVNPVRVARDDIISTHRYRELLDKPEPTLTRSEVVEKALLTERSTDVAAAEPTHHELLDLYDAHRGADKFDQYLRRRIRLAASELELGPVAVMPKATPAAAATVDVLPTGEQQPRLPEAGAVRDANVATPQFEAPFSLSGGAAERPTGRQGGLLDTPPAEAQTTEREPGETVEGVRGGAGAREGSLEADGESLAGVTQSVATRPESRKQTATRRAAHYDAAFAHVLDHARRVDPAVDAAEVRREFDARVDLHDELTAEAAEYGTNPYDVLRTIAKRGGLSESGSHAGEIRWLNDGKQAFGALAGVPKVFQKRYVRGIRAEVVAGHTLAEMAELIHQDYPAITNEHDLLEVLADAAAGKGERYGPTFPGTQELARRFGMQPDGAWWNVDPMRHTEVAADAESDASEAGLDDADTSFDPDDFDRGGGTGSAASMGRYAAPSNVTTAVIPPKADSRLFPPPPTAGGRGGGVARPVEFPELVDLARELQGVPKVVKRFRSPGWQGVFRHDYGIELLGGLFKAGEEYQAAKTLAHEIGHLVDWLPDKTLKRGNLLGRLRSLQSFLKGTFTGDDGRSVKNAEIRKELIALSAEWHPWDRTTAKPGYVAYRDSAVELYAEAISVLLNDPGMLAAQAPKFYKAFFEGLDAKPEVENAYFDLQEVLSGTPEELIARRRAGVRRMFEEGDVTALEIEQRRQAERIAQQQNLWFRLKVQHVDKNYAVIDKLNALQRQGVHVPDDENPLYLLEERNYVGGLLKGFTEEHFAPVFKAITDADIHWNAFGEALFYQRIIAGDRSEVANPRGLAPKDAADLYASLLKEFGTDAHVTTTTGEPDTPEAGKTFYHVETDGRVSPQVMVLQRATDKFRAAVKLAMERAYKAGLYTDELHQQMVDNPAYVTYQVLDHLEDGVTSRVYRQVGTLKDIANVADSTILKTLVTIRATEQQTMKRGVLDFLGKHFPGEITDAKTVWTGKGHKPIEPKDDKLRLITYLDKGKMVGKYVDRYIADAINNETVGNNLAVVSLLRKLNSGWMRPVFTTFNVGFQGFNFAKDFQRFWKNTPGMTLRRALQRYTQAVPMAKIRAFGLSKTPTAKDLGAYRDLIEAEKSKILSVTFNDLIAGRGVEDSQIEDIFARLNVGNFHTPDHAALVKPLMAVLDAIKAVGDFVETLPKAAGVYEFTGTGPIAKIPASQRSVIRRQLGSPDFLAGGTAKPIANELFLFSNAMVQGVRADYAAATAPSTRSGWWWKTASVNLLPKLLMVAALAGLAGDRVRRLYAKMTEYDRTNYIPIPLGEDAKGNAVYVRLPQDQTGQLIGGLFWKLLQLARGEKDVATTAAQVLDYTAGQVPNVSPGVAAVQAGTQMVAGQNPYDFFRGRNVLTDDEQKAGGLRAWKKFLGWEFQQLGGGIVWKFYPGEQRPQTETKGQRILDLPVVSNILGRFLRITNFGETEDLRATQAEVAKDEAERRLSERDAVYGAIRTLNALPPDERTPRATIAAATQIAVALYKDDPGEAVQRAPDIRRALQLGLLRSDADPVMDALMSATSNKQKLAILRRAIETGQMERPKAVGQ